MAPMRTLHILASSFLSIKYIQNDVRVMCRDHEDKEKVREYAILRNFVEQKVERVPDSRETLAMAYLCRVAKDAVCESYWLFE